MNKSGKKAGLKFFCEKCDYHARDNHDLKRHCSTRKHKMDNVDNGWITDARDSPHPYHCMLCNKKYKFKSGLCKHNKKFHSSNNIVIKKEIKCPLVKPHVVDIEKESLKEEVKELRNMVHEMVKAQHETNKNFHKTLDRVIDKAGTNNTYNNKMSINIFLNQKCKNAMNLTDFVDQLKVSLEDLIYTKDHGYVKGISNIFVKQLQDMKPTERPIHCSDRKRMQFYVKDEDIWKKDDIHSKIDKSIEDITMLQIKQIKQWEQEHPDYLTNETLLKQWHTMLQNAMGGSDGDDREKNKDSIKKELGISVEVKKELDND
tara:strand:+ start:151 stop:1098 length:948 start_codon:yes stop_codon:yes gene_type:complete